MGGLFHTEPRYESPGLGTVLLQHAPFLRMYADYVRNFEQAMELVRTWTERSSAFRTIIQDIQVRQSQCVYVYTQYFSICTLKYEGLSGMLCICCPVLESGGVWQPDPAAPHVGTSPEGATL